MVIHVAVAIAPRLAASIRLSTTTDRNGNSLKPQVIVGHTLRLVLGARRFVCVRVCATPMTVGRPSDSPDSEVCATASSQVVGLGRLVSDSLQLYICVFEAFARPMVSGSLKDHC